MGLPEFVQGIEALGHTVEHCTGNQVRFPYIIPCGRFSGQAITLGFEVPADFPLNPPSGPHVSPRILPLNPGASRHPEKVLESPNFGPDWEYWSRPFPNWAERGMNLRAYMAFIRHLFNTQ